MWALVDAGVWVVGVFMAAWLRYDLELAPTIALPL
jgi:hypothetical protein